MPCGCQSTTLTPTDRQAERSAARRAAAQKRLERSKPVVTDLTTGYYATYNGPSAKKRT